MVRGWLLPTFGGSATAALSREVVFLYVSPSKRVLGVLVMERLGQGYAGAAAPAVRTEAARAIDTSRTVAEPGVPGALAKGTPSCSVVPAATWEQLRREAGRQPCEGSTAGAPCDVRQQRQGVADGAEGVASVSTQSAKEDTHSQAAKEDTHGRAAHQEPLCGVRGVWVAPPTRRKGLASRMLGAARRHMVHGFVVPRSRLAFSQLSDDGRAWAEAYMGGNAIVQSY